MSARDAIARFYKTACMLRVARAAYYDLFGEDGHMERLSACRRAEEEFGNALFALEMLYGQDADPVAAIVAAERERCAGVCRAKAVEFDEEAAEARAAGLQVTAHMACAAAQHWRDAEAAIRAGAP